MRDKFPRILHAYAMQNFVSYVRSEAYIELRMLGNVPCVLCAVGTVSHSISRYRSRGRGVQQMMPRAATSRARGQELEPASWAGRADVPALSSSRAARHHRADRSLRRQAGAAFPDGGAASSSLHTCTHPLAPGSRLFPREHCAVLNTG